MIKFYTKKQNYAEKIFLYLCTENDSLNANIVARKCHFTARGSKVLYRPDHSRLTKDWQ